MDTPSYATWLGTALQFVAAYVAMRFPEHRMARWAVLGCGIGIAIGATLIWSGPGWQAVSRGWLLFPCGMALGLALGWLRKDWLFPPKAQDEHWRDRPDLEIYLIACLATGTRPTMEPAHPSSALSMQRLLENAIKGGTLHGIGDVSGDRQTGGGVMTRITHPELARFAHDTGNGTLLTFANDWKPTRWPDLRDTLGMASIDVDVTRLDADEISFAFRCFNGSGSPASVNGVSGEIEVQIEDGDEFVSLGVPALLPDRGGTRNVPYGGWLFPIVQCHIPTELVARLRGRLSVGAQVKFRFSELNVNCELHGAAKAYVRMPVWNLADCRMVDGRTYATQIITAAVVGKIQ